MQPNFTLKKLGPVFTKIFAIALIFVFSSQQSFAQLEKTSQRPKPIVVEEAKKPSQQNEAQTKVLEVVSDLVNERSIQNYAGINRPFQTEAICTTYTGTIVPADPTFNSGRINRNGVPTACGTPKVCAGQFNVGTVYRYKTFTYTNLQTVPQCITIIHANTGTSGAPHLSVHNGPFVPANICTNFIADFGQSPNPGNSVTFGFTIAGSATVTFVMTETAVDGFGSYSVSVDGICTPCVPQNAAAPVISSVPSTTCAGSPITLSILGGNLNGAAEWKWYTSSCGGTAVGTGTSITVSPTVTTTYFARGEGGCAPGPGACASQVVTVVNCACVTPGASTICAGTIQKLSVNGTGATSANPSSGAIVVAIPDANAAGVAHTIPVALPAGATITSVSANFNITHTWDGDLSINLKAPNGKVLNMVNRRGGSGDNFVNTTISPNATTPIANGTPPFTGTFLPDAALATGPTAYQSDALNFGELYSVPNGNWEIAIRDHAGGDLGTLTSWSLTINYAFNATAIWTGAAGTIFSNAAATTAYVAGTEANTVWVRPTVTTNYTATIAGGACAGANVIPITVLAKPVVTVSPNPGGCSPATLTAMGGNVYNWSPAATLNTTTGATVIATTPVNANYTVNGFGTNGCPFDAVTVPVTGSSIAAVISSLGAPPTIVWNEGFTTAIPLPAGWAQQNRSTTVGSTNWFQGNSGVFPAQSGAPTSYIAANFNSTTGNSTISNWLFTPVSTLANGDQLVFWTRTTDGSFPDRLQVRMSTNGASTDVGTTPTSTGDYSTLLLDINPNLTGTGYPTAWTQFTASVVGLAAPISGRMAFRYFVTSGGPAGANSDYIGIDNVTYQKPAAVTCAFNTSNIKVDITGGTSPYVVVYSDGTTNRTVSGYVSGTPIQVTPGVTTTYTIVSVTGANGCAGSGNTGTAVITVTPAPSITTQPPSRTICDGQNTTFTVTAGPALGTTYQWQVSTNGGANYTNLANGGVYSGVTLSTLTLTGVTTTLHNYMYRVVVTGACPPTSVTSTAGTLTVNQPPTITTQPSNTTRCVGTTATFTVVATTVTGTPTYQWQVSTNSGLTFANITGATAATLTLTNVQQIMNNNQYRVIVSVSPCTATATSTPRTLNINALPVVSITATDISLAPGQKSTITGTSTPAATSWSWTLNGAFKSGTTNTQLVDIDSIGSYRATVIDNQTPGCTASSNILVIGTEISDKLWIYPNPTKGAFQVRFYFQNNFLENRIVTIFNSLGQEITSRRISLLRSTPHYLRMDFDLTNMARGVYVVKVAHQTTKEVVSGLLLVQ